MRGHQIENRHRTQAKEYYTQSLICFHKAGANWEAAQMLGSLGGVAWNLGNYAAAADYHQQSLEARRAFGDLRGIAAASMSLGTTLLYQGEFAQAQTLIKEGSRLRREVGDRLGIADSLRNLGFARMLLGDFDEAINLLLEGVEIYQSLGLRYGLEMGMLAAALTHQGDFEQAPIWCERGLATARATGYRRALGSCLLKDGELALSLGEYAQAHQSLDESGEVYAQINQRDEGCRVLIAQAVRHLKTGEITQSEQILKQARSNLQTRRAFIPLLYCAPAQALLFEQRGEIEEARQWLRTVAPTHLRQNFNGLGHSWGHYSQDWLPNPKMRKRMLICGD